MILIFLSKDNFSSGKTKHQNIVGIQEGIAMRQNQVMIQMVIVVSIRLSIVHPVTYY